MKALLNHLLPALLLATVPAAAADLRNIAVLSAFAPELEAIRAEMIPPHTPVKTTTIHGTRFDEIDLHGHHFIFALSGVSMVNAAMSTQRVIDRFHADAVIFSGIAGGINPDLHPGDVIVPAKWIHQMESFWPNPDPAKPDAYVLPPGFKAKYGNYHGIFPDDVEVLREEGEEPESRHEFPADPNLLATAQRATANLKLEGARGGAARVILGTSGMSGPVFLDNASFRLFAFETWHVDGHDMESTAVAQVGWVNHVPVLIIRGLSDLAGAQAGPNQERIYLHLAAQNAAIVTAKTLEILSQ